MEEKIKLLIVDDHEMVRMGLCAYISTDESIEITAQASNGVEAVEKVMENTPDVILMDLVMEKMNGIEATKKIMEYSGREGLDIKVIILTSFIEEDKVMPALEAGAISYMLKTSPAQDVVRAVKMAYRGESMLEGKVSQVMLKSRMKPAAKHDMLTERELEILKEIGKGKTNKEISESLFIGVKTVKTHVSNILSKLELEDRTKAAVYANKNKIV